MSLNIHQQDTLYTCQSKLAFLVEALSIAPTEQFSLSQDAVNGMASIILEIQEGLQFVTANSGVANATGKEGAA